MNNVQLHERVRFWIDLVASTRFESEDIDNALNVAIDNKVRESYDQNRPMNRSDSFQRVQRLRDELGPLVKRAVDGNGLSVTGNIVSLTVSNYGWLLAMNVKPYAETKWYNAKPLTYNRKNVLSANPFRRIRKTPNRNVYYNELDGDFEITIFEGDSISDAEIYYLAIPSIVLYGVERDSSYIFTNGEYVVAAEDTVYNGVTYQIGEKFQVTLGNGLTITSGTVVHQFTECDVRETTHEEISRRAAINLLMTADMGNKAKALREEIQAS